LYSCDITSFSSETQNKNYQAKITFLCGHGLRAQPYFKHSCSYIHKFEKVGNVDFGNYHNDILEI